MHAVVGMVDVVTIVGARGVGHARRVAADGEEGGAGDATALGVELHLLGVGSGGGSVVRARVGVGVGVRAGVGVGIRARVRARLLSLWSGGGAPR